MTSDGISRRTMIKRAGVGAGLVWAAPAVASFASASAQEGSPPAGGDCTNCTPDQPCNQFFPCGDGSCPCITRADGNGCACVENTCTGIACGPNLECPAGTVCTESCCGRECLRICGTGQSEGTGRLATLG